MSFVKIETEAKYPPDQLFPARLKGGPRVIESFLVGRMVCRLTTNNYTRLVLDLIQVLQKRGIELANDIIIEFLGEQTADSREWPYNQKLRDAFLTLPLYHYCLPAGCSLCAKVSNKQSRSQWLSNRTFHGISLSST